MPGGFPQSTWPWRRPRRLPGCEARHSLRGLAGSRASRQGAACRTTSGRVLSGARACRVPAWERKVAYFSPSCIILCAHSFYCLPSQLSMQAQSPKVINATRAITVSRQAPISFGATAPRLLTAQTLAPASRRAVERTTFLLAMHKALMKSPTNVPGVNSAQTRVPVVNPFSPSAVNAN